MSQNIMTRIVDKYLSFFQVDFIVLVGVTRHAQSTQNKFSISLQYLKKEGRDEPDLFSCRYTSSFPVKLRLSILVGIAIHNQSTNRTTLKNPWEISEKLQMKLVLHAADKHQSFI